MSAVAYSYPQISTAPELALVPPYVRPASTGVSVFWRRRIVALLVLATLVVGAWSLVGMGVGLVSSQTAATAATTGPNGASPAAQPQPVVQQWTVRPGDTLWSIARSIKPAGDIRSVLDPLIKQYAGQPLQVGQVIHVAA